MLLLSNKRIRLSLGKDFFAIAIIENRHILKSTHINLDRNSENWVSPIIDHISESTSQLTSKIKTEVVISSDLSPIIMLPWQDKTNSKKLQEGLARYHFDKIFDPAETSFIAVASTGYKKPWLASRLNLEIIHDIQRALPTIDIISIEPLSISIFNYIIRTVKENTFWIVVPESTRLTLFLTQNNTLMLVKSIPSNEIAMLDLAQLMQREMRLHSIKDIVCSVYSLSEEFDKLHKIKPAWINTPESQAAYSHLLGA